MPTFELPYHDLNIIASIKVAVLTIVGVSRFVPRGLAADLDTSQT